MILTRVLSICFAFVTLSEAFIEFQKSRIFDELDFLNDRSVAVPNYCSVGCDIYVSVPKDSIDIAKNIFIVRDSDDSKKTSIVNANSNNANGQRKPYVYKGAQVNFKNENNGLKSAPLLIWMVRQDAPNYDAVEIYEADGFNRAKAPAGLITIMSAAPFVLTTQTEGLTTVSAFTAGFDAFDSADKCTRILRQEDPSTYQDVGLAVYSPLITFFFDKMQYPDAKVALHASQNDAPSFDLATPKFVSSAGYIGCSVAEGPDVSGKRTKTFRSTLYDGLTEVAFKSNDLVSIKLTGDFTNDADHPVAIVADGAPLFNWYSANGDQEIDVTTKELNINCARDEKDLNQYFMIRVEQDHESPKTTTVEPEEPAKTTTVEPEQPAMTTTAVPEEPLKTTSLEPEEPNKTTTTLEQEEPVKTTTVGPVEPVKTTTAVPEELVKTTTVEPEQPVMTTTLETEEPIKTTTVLPEEPVKTTTSEPEEPVKTTSVVPEEPVKTTTVQPEIPDETTTVESEQPVKTTTVIPEEPIQTTTAEHEAPIKTTTDDSQPEPEKTTTSGSEPEPTENTRRPTSPLPPRRTTPHKTKSTTSFHPKSTVTSTSTTTTQTPTTSGAGYGTFLLSIVLASAVFRA